MKFVRRETPATRDRDVQRRRRQPAGGRCVWRRGPASHAAAWRRADAPRLAAHRRASGTGGRRRLYARSARPRRQRMGRRRPLRLHGLCRGRGGGRRNIDCTQRQASDCDRRVARRHRIAAGRRRGRQGWHRSGLRLDRAGRHYAAREPRGCREDPGLHAGTRGRRVHNDCRSSRRGRGVSAAPSAPALARGAEEEFAAASRWPLALALGSGAAQGRAILRDRSPYS